MSSASGSDSDEEKKPALKKQRIYYGSLEAQERERLEKEKLAAEELLRAQGSDSSEEESENDSNSDNDQQITKTKKKKQAREKKLKEKAVEAESRVSSAVDKAIASGNINVADGDTMVELSEDLAEERQSELMQEFEKRKMKRSINVSTDDKMVKAKLRELGHPICLFGEGPANRRERLRDLFSVFEQLIPGYSKELQLEGEEKVEEKEEEKPAEIWYHEGLEALKVARLFIAEYSLLRADKRLSKLRRNWSTADDDLAVKTQEVHRKSRALINFCSQIGDSRPLSHCQFSPNGKLLATASWSGLCKLWSVPDGNEVRTLTGHSDRVGCIAFHPSATVDLDETAVNIVSCDANGGVQLWNLVDEKPIGNIEGHEEQRVTSVAFHPSGRFLGTTCFDKSWRLWDMEAQEEVLHQEGHAKEVYRISFQHDGALAATAGYDARGLIWDLRTGRNVVALDGHLSKVLAVDFSPNSYCVATGSEDQTCKVWDLRKRACVYTIPSHNNIVSHVKFCANTLFTASFDGLAKVWSVPMYTALKVLDGHEQKVTCIDVTGCGNYIATCSFDRTFKLWAPEFLV